MEGEYGERASGDTYNLYLQIQLFFKDLGRRVWRASEWRYYAIYFYKSNFSSKIWDGEYGERASGDTYYLYLQIFKDLGSGDTCNLYLPIQLFFKELGR